MAHLGQQPHVRHNLIFVTQFFNRVRHGRNEATLCLNGESIVKMECLPVDDASLASGISVCFFRPVRKPAPMSRGIAIRLTTFLHTPRNTIGLEGESHEFASRNFA